MTDVNKSEKYTFCCCKPTRFGHLSVNMVKNLPAMWETWVLSVGWEDPLEKAKATHSSILARKIPWASPWGGKESDATE